MLNIIKADMYRILRGKGFYITTIILVLFIVTQVMSNNAAGVFVTTNTNDSLMVTYDENGNEVITSSYEEPPKYTGSLAPFKMMENADVLFYFILPFIIFAVSADFSADTIKNTISGGMPRIKYYLSKLILSFLFCFYVLFVTILISIITGTILYGFGGQFNLDLILRILRPFLAQLFMLISVNCVGVFFVFLTKRPAVMNVSYIAFCLLPIMIMSFIIMAKPDFEFLFNYDNAMNIRLLAGIDTAASTDIIRAFMMGGIYILASTIGGILIFKKSEIK